MVKYYKLQLQSNQTKFFKNNNNNNQNNKMSHNNNHWETPAPASKKTKLDNKKNNPQAPHRNPTRRFQAKRTKDDRDLPTRTIQNNLAFTTDETSTAVVSGLFGPDEKELTPGNLRILVTAVKANKVTEFQALGRHIYQSDTILKEVTNLLLDPNTPGDIEKIFICQAVNKKVTDLLVRVFDEEGDGDNNNNMDDNLPVEQQKVEKVMRMIMRMKKKMETNMACFAVRVHLILMLEEDICDEERWNWYKVNANQFNIHDCKQPANIPVITNNADEEEKIKEKTLNIKLKNLAKTLGHSIISANFETKQNRTALRVGFIR